MPRLDRLDMSVFQFNDGRNWAEELFCEQIRAYNGKAPKGCSVFIQMLRTPDMLRLCKTKWFGKWYPAGDLFLDVLSCAPHRTMEQYEALRDLARRFGRGANDWIDRTVSSDTNFERRLGEPVEPRPTRAAVYEKLTSSDSLQMFPLDSDFVPGLLAAAGKLKNTEGHIPVNIDPEAQLAVANLCNFPHSKDSSTGPQGLPVELAREYMLHVPWNLPLWLDNSGERSMPSADVLSDLRGISALKYLEPYAREVLVKRDHVTVKLDGTPRPKGQPLFYRFGEGWRRNQLYGETPLLRIEANVASGMDEDAVSGVIRDIAGQHASGAQMFIEGSKGRAEVEKMSPFIGSPFGFQPGVVDLLATGPGAGVALTSAFTALGGVRPMA